MTWLVVLTTCFALPQFWYRHGCPSVLRFVSKIWEDWHSNTETHLLVKRHSMAYYGMFQNIYRLSLALAKPQMPEKEPSREFEHKSENCRDGPRVGFTVTWVAWVNVRSGKSHLQQKVLIDRVSCYGAPQAFTDRPLSDTIGVLQREPNRFLLQRSVLIICSKLQEMRQMPVFNAHRTILFTPFSILCSPTVVSLAAGFVFCSDRVSKGILH